MDRKELAKEIEKLYHEVLLRDVWLYIADYIIDREKETACKVIQDYQQGQANTQKSIQGIMQQQYEREVLKIKKARVEVVNRIKKNAEEMPGVPGSGHGYHLECNKILKENQ